MLVTSNQWDIIAALDESGPLTLDLETTGLHPRRDKIAVISLQDGRGHSAVFQTNGKPVPGQLEAWIAAHDLITQNGTVFDLVFFDDMTPASHFDTRTAEAIVGPMGKASNAPVRANLGALTAKYTGSNLKLKMPETSWTVDTLTPEQIRYIEADIDHLSVIARCQRNVADDFNALEAIDLEMALTVPVADMIRRGMPVSIARIDEAATKRDKDTKNARARLSKQFGTSFNPRSAAQVKAAFAKVGVTLDDTTHGTLVACPHPLAKDLMTVRSASKRDSMFSDEWIAEHVTDGRVHSQFLQCGTDTYRFTSSRPNLQQIPKDMRGVVQADDGYKIVSIDYSQLELRVLACLASDQKLMDAMAGDLHTETAKAVALSAGVNYTDSLRSKSKGVTFTWAFGGGVTGAVKAAAHAGEALDPDDAKKIIRGIAHRFPSAQAWMNAKRKDAESGQPTVVLDLGYRRSWAGQVPSAAYINTFVQGNASIAFKKVQMHLYRSGFLDEWIAPVHDEMAFHVCNRDAEDFAKEASEVMSSQMADVFGRSPSDFPVNATVGQNWS